MEEIVDEVMTNSLKPHVVHGNSPGKNTGVGCHALLLRASLVAQTVKNLPAM